MLNVLVVRYDEGILLQLIEVYICITFTMQTQSQTMHAHCIKLVGRNHTALCLQEIKIRALHLYQSNVHTRYASTKDITAINVTYVTLSLFCSLQLLHVILK